jgi:isopentenyl-diphosphate delta-isomerase
MNESQTLLLVNENDSLLGYVSREEAHRGEGKRHRAFVTLLFDKDDKVLLQRRRHALFNGYWDLTAISHPLHIEGRDESYQEASDRALTKEMAIGHVPVRQAGGFIYFAQDGANCENEYCAVLIGEYDGDFDPNPAEVHEARRLPFQEFRRELLEHPETYTPWAQLALQELEKFRSGRD